jgi:2-polyprenyl-6-methoxyphenol hydroxylase-like FAD-dependent oxidoreductase
MRVVIVGGGMAGLVLTHALAARGVTPVVVERMPEGAPAPGPILLPFLAYDALRDIGRYDEIHDAGWEIGPREGQPPVAIAVGRDEVLAALRRGAEVEHRTEVVQLLRAPDPGAPGGARVAGVRARGPGGERDIPADLVVGADGSHSRVREMAGIPAEVRLSPGAGMSFTSPVVIDRSFAMAYQSNGRQVGLVGWPGGSAGWWQVDRVEGGEPAARAPGVEAFKRSFTRLLPAAAAALEGVTSIEQIGYREMTEVRCETWWTPGVVLIGEAAHAIDPEAGVGAGLGFGDALALAVAVAGTEDPDQACRDYEFWRRPAVAPYEAIGAAGARMVPPGSGEKPDAERWPPVG